jgi:hypothetical protein
MGMVAVVTVMPIVTVMPVVAIVAIVADMAAALLEGSEKVDEGDPGPENGEGNIDGAKRFHDR